MHLNQREGVAIPREAALDAALAGAKRWERWTLPCDASPTEGRAKGCPYRLGKKESPTPRVETAVFGEDPQAAVRDSLVGRGHLIPILGTPCGEQGRPLLPQAQCLKKWDIHSTHPQKEVTPRTPHLCVYVLYL